MSVVVSETAAPGITRIAINRPDKRNAVSPEARNALIEAVSVALADNEGSCHCSRKYRGPFLRWWRYRFHD